jgi:hypothetical protein
MSKNITLREIITFCAENLKMFSADELNLLAKFTGYKPRNNEISSCILWAKGQKLIERTEKGKISAFYDKNAVLRTVWKSLITGKKEVVI